ncbi:hypothetical protein GCM10009558_041010 [Virgisporangium aurantiacum]
MLDLLAAELRRVRAEHGNEAIFGGSYGWASAGRFHHAQSQLHRFLNLFGGFTGSRNSYSNGTSVVLLPHVVGDADTVLRKASSWPTITANTELVVAFGGIPAKNVFVTPGGITRHGTPGHLAALAERNIEVALVSPLRTDLPPTVPATWYPVEPGTDVALMHLYGISETVKFAGLRDKARERIAEIADDLGLSAAELADRLVPDFGLDGDGGMVLDFGPRRFTVGFDEQLKPYVVDGSGKRRANLPKPGAGDDPGLAPAAAKRFAALRKDVRTAAGDQLRRLERAMVSGRRWSAGDFATYLAGHPLVRHIVRRLVWTTDTGGSFRVAEDGTYADASDDTYALPPDASVAVAHPVGLGPATKAWAEVFTDYEILQPFPQLGRETFALTDAERAATSLERWSGRIVPTGTLLGLERRGWRRADPQDAGNQPWFERDAPGGDRLLIMIDPGIPVGSPTDIPEQCVGTVVIVRSDDYEWQPRYPQRIGTLDDVTASELIRDMQEVVQ